MGPLDWESSALTIRPYNNWGKETVKKRACLTDMLSRDQAVKEEIAWALEIICPRDIEILGWCPAGPVLPHVEQVPL